MGNICRSPMAEGLLRYRLAGRAEPKTTSAGIGALVSHPADPIAVELMAARGIDISAHRGRQLDKPTLLAHGLVLVMERAHLYWISSRYPEARGRVFLLGHWRDGEDVVDPYRQERPVFEHALDQIDVYLGDWLKRLAIGFK